jgi:hypothetical protein
MDADLVQTAGHGAALNQGGAHVFGEHAVGGLGLPAAGGEAMMASFLSPGRLGSTSAMGLLTRPTSLLGALLQTAQ